MNAFIRTIPDRGGGPFPGRLWPVVLTPLTVLCLVFGAQAEAVTPRSVGLGGGADLLEDAHGTGRWPGSLPDYAGRWWLDSGGFNLAHGFKDSRGWAHSGVEGGVHLPLEREGGHATLSLTFNRRATDSDPGSLLRDHPASSSVVILGRRFGRAQIAFLWRLSRGKVDESSAGTSFDHRRHDLGAGLRVDLTDGAYLDLAVDRRHRGDQAVLAAAGGGTVATGELDPDSSWSARARAFVAAGPRFVLVPVLAYLDENVASPLLGGTRRIDRVTVTDGYALRLGVGLHHTPDPDRLHLVSMSWTAGRAHHADLALAGPPAPSFTAQHRILEVRLATERRLSWWLSLRGALTWERFENRGGTAWPATDTALDIALGGTIHLGGHGISLAATSREPRGLSRFSDLAPPGDDTLWFSLGYHRDY